MRLGVLYTPLTLRVSPLAFPLACTQRGLSKLMPCVRTPLCAEACCDGERGRGCVKSKRCHCEPKFFQTVTLPSSSSRLKAGLDRNDRHNQPNITTATGGGFLPCSKTLRSVHRKSTGISQSIFTTSYFPDWLNMLA